MALILDNITLQEYYNLDYDQRFNYTFAMKYSKQFNSSVDIFDIGDFTELGFGFIKDLQHEIAEGITWVKFIGYIRELTGKKEKDIGNYKLIELSQFASYMRGEIERINEIETSLLSYTPGSDEVEAGINNFAKFGSYPQLRKLANEDLTKLEEIKKIKYSTCLMELLYSKTETEFKEALVKIKTRK